MTDITSDVGDAFDVVRSELGPDTQLEFINYQMASGETVLASVAAGWRTLALKGSLQVEVIENALLDNGGTLSSAHVYTAQRLRIGTQEYSIPDNAITRPLAEPRLWVIQASEIRPLP